jgi:hypothetical protein
MGENGCRSVVVEHVKCDYIYMTGETSECQNEATEYCKWPMLIGKSLRPARLRCSVHPVLIPGWTILPVAQYFIDMVMDL